MVDHLFRHQYGKMVAILSKIFGLDKLELIEDAIQDTFLQAALKWRIEKPENPEAWLTMAAKNRVIDLLRKINAQKLQAQKSIHASAAIEINDYFLDHEVADSQLRMLFVACHPAFSKDEQIAFALKTISGFSMKEISAALLQKDETIKKRLVRARKKIHAANIRLEYPDAREIQARLSGVLQIIYLIFNEGFQSTKQNDLINHELCGEALRLCQLLLKKEQLRSGGLYALFALLCYHSSRLEAKLVEGKIVDLKNQDRSKWHLPLIVLGNNALDKATEYADFSLYHLEAAIASEHVRALSFENTNWERIVSFYDQMLAVLPSDNFLLSKAIALMQMGKLEVAKKILDTIKLEAMHQRKYLVYGAIAEYYLLSGLKKEAIEALEKAIASCSSELEIAYLKEKQAAI